MAYSVNDLLTLFRREVEDPAFFPDRNLPDPNSLWSNFELLVYLNEAQKEFAERTLIFKDSQQFTPAITEDDPWVDLDCRILRIDHAELDSTNQPIPLMTIRDFQTAYYIDDYGVVKPASWETRTGTPQIAIRDIEQSKLRLYPIPEEDDILLLTVRRLPMEDITQTTDDLEVPNRWRLQLLDGIRARAFLKPTAIAMFGPIYKEYQIEWEKTLDRADSRVKIRTRGPGQVGYGGI